ncbi:MAG: hypothetical protein MUC49_22315 [Raineya sp.]|jgi:hypothetical protein|nr:hypothetical protein [Raineya sp.]
MTIDHQIRHLHIQDEDADLEDVYKMRFITDFKTPIESICCKGVDFYLGLVSSEGMFFTNCEKFIVEWEITPASNQQGLLYLDILIKRISGTIYWSYALGGKISKTGEFSFDSELNPYNKWKLSQNILFGEQNKLMPENIFIDFIECCIKVN